MRTHLNSGRRFLAADFGRGAAAPTAAALRFAGRGGDGGGEEDARDQPVQDAREDERDDVEQDQVRHVDGHVPGCQKHGSNSVLQSESSLVLVVKYALGFLVHQNKARLIASCNRGPAKFGSQTKQVKTSRKQHTEASGVVWFLFQGRRCHFMGMKVAWK